MAKFACLPTFLVVKKKKSKGFSKAAGDLRVKPSDLFSPSPENHLTVSKSIPSVEKRTCIIPKLLSDDSLARAESTGDAAYEGGDENDEIRSMKREYSDLDLQTKGELASHGSNTDLNSYAFEKTETDKGIAAKAMIASGHVSDPGIAFSLGSSHVDRVNAWVNSLEDCSLFSVEHCDGMENERTADLHDLEIVESSEKTCSQTNRRVAEEVALADNIIQYLNTLSTVAHITGIGLKVIPSISVFVCLRSVNLSGNCIVNITPGSLPKGLHTLDLSRNKISTIEGLRDLERLRVLNLSYNRIAKISHGLSSCTLIKELYLAGNKISNVEGLHRLLKLTVLDLSFNKIITANGLGQLVANYNSLLALNLIGNPILANIGDDQVRKAVLSLLPHVTYLNKQSIKPDKVREVVSESVTKAALGDVAGSSKRKLTKRLSVTKAALETVKHGKSRQSTSGKLTQ